jgi:hypothetical protein
MNFDIFNSVWFPLPIEDFRLQANVFFSLALESEGHIIDIAVLFAYCNFPNLKLGHGRNMNADGTRDL